MSLPSTTKDNIKKVLDPFGEGDEDEEFYEEDKESWENEYKMLSGSMLLFVPEDFDKALQEFHDASWNPRVSFAFGPAEDRPELETSALSSTMCAYEWMRNIPEFNNGIYEVEIGCSENEHHINLKGEKFATAQQVEQAVAFVKDTLEKHLTALGIPLEIRKYD